MISYPQRSAQGLSRAFSLFGIRVDITTIEHDVIVPAAAAQQVLTVVSHVEGGNRVPFIRSLLRSPGRADVILRGDEARHLMRALEELHRQQHRNEQLDRGVIPGALSSSEVTRLIRRHPKMFNRGPANGA